MIAHHLSAKGAQSMRSLRLAYSLKSVMQHFHSATLAVLLASMIWAFSSLNAQSSPDNDRIDGTFIWKELLVSFFLDESAGKAILQDELSGIEGTPAEKKIQRLDLLVVVAAKDAVVNMRFNPAAFPFATEGQLRQMEDVSGTIGSCDSFTATASTDADFGFIIVDITDPQNSSREIEACIRSGLAGIAAEIP